jgi:hypothetical protein
MPPTETHLFRYKVETAQRVELVAHLVPQCLDLCVLPLELLVSRILDLCARRLRLVLLLVDLRERLGRLRVLQFQISGRQECVGLVRAHADGRVKIIVNDPFLDQVFERLDCFLGDDRYDLAGVLKVEILLQKRVLRPGARRCFSEKCPVLGPDRLRFQLGNLFLQCELLLLVR